MSPKECSKRDTLRNPSLSEASQEQGAEARQLPYRNDYTSLFFKKAQLPYSNVTRRRLRLRNRLLLH